MVKFLFIWCGRGLIIGTKGLLRLSENLNDPSLGYGERLVMEFFGDK
jgi:hypothetical protein